MIVKDETDTLRACLASVKDAVDEIVVAWNGTNPQTEAILKEFGAKIVPYVWKDDFADARTVSFQAASHELVLWLDADDVVIHPERIKPSLNAFLDPRIGSVWSGYDYDQNEYGDCVMLLFRERITRKSWWAWKGRIHETQQPTKACAHVRLAVEVRGGKLVPADPETWWVKHTVLPGRVVASADRNLRIAQAAYQQEQEAGALDPRTVYDYGRALKASGNREKAIEAFQEFLRLSEFDPDKYEAWLSIADCYRKFRMYHEAEKAEFEAIRLCPQRAEAYFSLAETCFCQERFADVVWFTRVGFGCPPREDNLPVDPVALQARPLLALHFAQFQQGQFHEALATAQKALQFFPKNQFLQDSVVTYQEAIRKEALERSWLDIHTYLAANGESSKLPALARCIPNFVADHPVAVRLKNRFDPPQGGNNRLVIYCGPSYELWDPKCAKEGIGGSEEAVMNLAPKLAALGWNVEVYNNCLEEGNYDGALWKPFWTYDQSVPAAVFIAWRDSRSILLAPEGAFCTLWLHDMCKADHFSQEQLSRVNEVWALSQYHAGVARQAIGPDVPIWVTANGIISSQFLSETPRDPLRCIYASSPDRGLDTLLQVWPQIREKVPQAELHVYYGFTKNYDELHRHNQAMLDFKDWCLKALKQPGVVYHGRVSHEAIAKAMQESALWTYPTQFTEISCITAMKAQAGGAIPITADLAALTETVFGGYKLSFSFADRRTQLSFVQIIVDLLTHPEKQDKLRAGMREEARKRFDWSTVASSWNDHLRACLTPTASKPTS